MAMQTAMDLSPRLIGRRVRIESVDVAVEGVLSHLVTDVDSYGPMETLGGQVLREKTYRLVSIKATVGGHELYLTGNESLEEL